MSSVQATRLKLHSITPTFLLSRHFIFLLLNLSTALDLVNVTALLVSTKYISEHYGITPSVASWSLSAYAIAFSGFIAFFGRVGDIIGHDNQFIIMTFLFSIASLICAVVDDIYVYIVFRAFQGFFAAGLIPSNYAITAYLYQGKQLTNAISFLTGTLNFSIVIGLIVGGAFLRTDVKIHGIAYLSFGLALAISLTAIFTFPDTRGTSKDRLKDLDYLGSGVLISGLLLIVVGFTEGGESWRSPKSYVTLIVGIVLTGFFFIYEKYLCLRYFPTTHLLIPPQVWRIPNYAPLVTNALLNYAGFFGAMLINVSYSLNIDHTSPLLAGVRYMPFTIALIISTWTMSLMYGKFSERWVCITGLLTGTVGLILLTRINYATPNYYWKFSMTGQIFLASGSCIYFVHFLNMIISNAPMELQGIVTGIAQTFGQFGVALAFAVVTSIVGDVEKLQKDQLTKKYEYAAWFCVACYGSATVLFTVFVRDVKKGGDKENGNEIPETIIEHESDDDKIEV